MDVIPLAKNDGGPLIIWGCFAPTRLGALEPMETAKTKFPQIWSHMDLSARQWSEPHLKIALQWSSQSPASKLIGNLWFELESSPQAPDQRTCKIFKVSVWSNAKPVSLRTYFIVFLSSSRMWIILDSTLAAGIHERCKELPLFLH